MFHRRKARSDNLSDAFIEITLVKELKGFYIHKYIILILIFQIMLKYGLVLYAWQTRIFRFCGDIFVEIFQIFSDTGVSFQWLLSA